MTALAYLPTNGAEFIWDDPSYLTENPNIFHPIGLLRIFLSPIGSPQYYPMVFGGFWVEYRLWGLDPAGYHRVNVALHGLNAILVWRVARRLISDPAAWLAGAIFALHPVHVESVAWITERKNVLSGTFYAASLLAYWRSSARDCGGIRRGWYLVSFLCFLAALGSKSVACSLPAAILVLIWWERGRIGKSDIVPLLPYFVVGFLAGSFTSWLERHHVGAFGHEFEFTIADRILIAGRSAWFYAAKLAWPTHLSFIYTRWRIDPTVWWQWAYPLAAVALVATAWAARDRLGRAPLASLLFFGGTLLPALGFINIYPMRYSFVADHFQYLASLGLIVPAAWLIDRAAGRWPLAGRVAVGVLLLSLGLASYSRCFAFHGHESLWTDTLTKTPDCWMAHNNYGTWLISRGQEAEGRRHFESALALNPESAEAQSNLGLVQERSDEFEAAERHLRLALALDSNHWRSYYGLGLIRRKQGRDREAADFFRAVLRIKPDDRGSRSQLLSMNLEPSEPSPSTSKAPGGESSGP